MRKTLLSATVLIAALAMLTLAAPAQAGDSFTGEVLDHACFVQNNAHGPDHAECAKKCLEDGGQVGLLTADGDVYILKAHADHTEAFETLVTLAAQQATVTGEVTEEDGAMIITVTEVTPATS